MRTNTLKHAWKDQKPTLGLWVSCDNPVQTEQLADLDFDYVCVDLQHGLIDYSGALAAMQAMRHSDAIPLCRAPWNEPGIIGKLLDAGALGIIIPMVNTAEQCEAAVSACRYAPRGGRSFGPTRAATVHGPSYYDEVNDEVACIPMIETVEALENLDAILDVEGVDAVYVGPADLSISLGLPPGSDQDAKSFTDALSAIVAACEQRGIAPGIHTTPTLAPKRIEQGFKLLTVTSDLGAAASGARDGLRVARSGTGAADQSERMY